MTDKGSTQHVLKSHSMDFLIAQYQALSDSFWRNEELGERRVNFVIVLVAAVLAALVALSEVQGPWSGEFLLLSISALVALLLLGIVTWRRMLHRNRVTDEYKRCMEIIGSSFVDCDGSLKAYRPFPKVLLFCLDWQSFDTALPKVPKAEKLPPESPQCRLRIVRACFPESKFNFPKPEPVSDAIRCSFLEYELELGKDAETCVKEEGKRWLVIDRDEDRTCLLRRKSRKYVIQKQGDLLAIFQPRSLTGGGLAEMVATLNSLFVGAILTLIFAFAVKSCCATNGSSTLLSMPSWLVLGVGVLGVIGSVVFVGYLQYLFMKNYYEQHDIFVPEGGM